LAIVGWDPGSLTQPPREPSEDELRKINKLVASERILIVGAWFWSGVQPDALMLEELAAPLTGSEEWKALGGKTWL
jgi:hypothetical protein